MEHEADLVRRSRAGDRDAFNDLVELYQGPVFNLALRMLADQGLAADAAQDTFISAYRALSGFRGGLFRAWLLRIAGNTCRDYLRSAKARRSVSLEALDPSVLPPSSAESPEEYAIRRELNQEIQRGLMTLPEDQRLVLVLVDVQGYSYEEAASITRSALGTVRSRLSRARGRLRDYLVQRPELLPASLRPDSGRHTE